MANLTKSADALIAEVAASVRQELFSAIEPIARKITEAVAEMEKALSAVQGKATVAAPVRRRGRRPGRPKAVKAVAEPAVKRTKKTAKKAAGRPAKAAAGKRSPRGALQNEIVAALQRASSPLTLTRLRDEVLKSSEFKGRDEKNIYTMISQTIKRVPNVERTGEGYKLK